MASPIEVMDVSDAAAGGDGGFTEVVNPKKRLRENSEPGSPRGERQSEATVTIKPVLSKQSVAKLNGLAVAREINRIAGGSVARVQKRSNLIIVTAHNSKQAMTMANETKFCGVEVTITMGRPVGSAKGVIMGIPHELEDEEILAALSNQGITAAKRIQKKVGGQLQKTTAIQLTFKTKMPEIINFGYEKKKVRPYVPPVIRCFKCQQYGHGSDKCRGRVHCAACGEGHEWKECPNKSSPKCARCGGAHSAAYMGCVAYKEAKQVQTYKFKEKVSYSEALKAVKKQKQQKELTKEMESNKASETPKTSYSEALKAGKKQKQQKELTKEMESNKASETPKTSTDPSKSKGQEKKAQQKTRIPKRPTQKANNSQEAPIQSEKTPSLPKRPTQKASISKEAPVQSEKTPSPPKPTTKTSECQTDAPVPSHPTFNPDQFLALIAFVINSLDINKSKSDRIQLVVCAAEKCCGIKISPNKIHEVLSTASV